MPIKCYDAFYRSIVQNIFNPYFLNVPVINNCPRKSVYRSSKWEKLLDLPKTARQVHGAFGIPGNYLLNFKGTGTLIDYSVAI